LIPAVDVELQQEGVEAEQRTHQQHATIAVLDVGGVDDVSRPGFGGGWFI
jgi:hypothetical protein